MNMIMFLIIALSVGQLLVCKFTLYWIIAVICRIIFMARVIGAQVKLRNLAIGEVVAFVLMVLVNMLFNKDNVPWLRILEYLAFSLVTVGLEALDGLLYVYLVEDEEPDEEDYNNG